ncbi:MAG TPA: hypothetical protein VFE47_18970 [Tepidisphaeraceae bacterium]|jgi:hypothetical protein|nr:hypothetical protein [Tepidisphaeraceae bacterium]
MKTPAKKEKPYWEMSVAELKAATKEFDRAIPLSKTKPLTASERKLWNRMRKGPAISVYVKRSADEVLVKLDPDVRARSLRYANTHKLTMSELINRSLKGLLTIVD